MADDDDYQYPEIPKSALESETGFRVAVLMCNKWLMKTAVVLMKKQKAAKKSRREIYKRIRAIEAALQIDGDETAPDPERKFKFSKEHKTAAVAGVAGAGGLFGLSGFGILAYFFMKALLNHFGVDISFLP